MDLKDSSSSRLNYTNRPYNDQMSLSRSRSSSTLQPWVGIASLPRRTALLLRPTGRSTRLRRCAGTWFGSHQLHVRDEAAPSRYGCQRWCPCLSDRLRCLHRAPKDTSRPTRNMDLIVNHTAHDLRGVSLTMFQQAWRWMVFPCGVDDKGKIYIGIGMPESCISTLHSPEGGWMMWIVN